MQPKTLNVFDEFGVSKPCSAKYFLEVGARVSLKLATKGFLRGSVTKKLELFLNNLALVNLAQLHVFWKLVHAFH